MRGDLETEGNLHVKGRVFGNVRCVSVICEVGALIDGEIDAEDVTVRGETVASDIFHESFGCEQGARISGRLALLSDDNVTSQQAEAAAAERRANSDRSDGADANASHRPSPIGATNGNPNGSAY